MNLIRANVVFVFLNLILYCVRANVAFVFLILNLTQAGVLASASGPLSASGRATAFLYCVMS